MRYIGYGTAAATAVALATTAGLLWPGGSAAAQVQKALGKAEQAKSVKVTMTLENKGEVTHTRILYRQGDLIRMETVRDAEVPDEPVIVADLKARTSLTLSPGEKVARRGALGEREARLLTGVLGSFTDLKAELSGGDDKAVKDLGVDKIGDRKVRAYEVSAKGPPAGVWKAWVDPKTDFPVRARLADDKGNSAFTLDFEDWNKEFDPKLFELTVPKGYREVKE